MARRRRAGILSCVVVVALFSSSVPRAETWIRELGDGTTTSILGGQATRSGRFLLAAADGNGTTLTVVNADGSVLWNRRVVGGAAGAEVSALAESPTGALFLVGRTSASGAGLDDAWVARLDAAGRTVWQRTLGGAEDDRAHALFPMADGGLLLAGETRSFGAGGPDALLVRLAPSGAVSWARTYGGAGDEALRAVRELEGGELLAAGAVGAGEPDGLVLRLDDAGNVLWSRTYGPGAMGAIAEPGNGDVLLAREPDRIARLDAAGAVVWLKSYDAGAPGSSIDAVSSGPTSGLVAAGRIDGSLWIARLTQAGFASWQWALDRPGGGQQGGRATSIHGADHGGYFVAGDDSGDVLALNLDGDGAIDGPCNAWAAGAATPADEPASSVAIALSEAEAPGLQVAPAAVAVTGATPVSSAVCTGSADLKPAEVSPPAAVDAPLAFTGAATFAWEAGAPSTSIDFDVYRGDIRSLGAPPTGECLLEDLPSSTATDLDVPPAGTAWFYVVRGENTRGRGELGHDSAGRRRPRGRPCDPYGSCGTLRLSFHCTPLLETDVPGPLGNTIFFVENTTGFGINDRVYVEGAIETAGSGKCPLPADLCPYPCIVDNIIEERPVCSGEL